MYYDDIFNSLYLNCHARKLIFIRTEESLAVEMD